MATGTRWAPLVYARTLKVDFRLLAIPDGMDAVDLDWLRECIEGSTVDPDHLRDHSRVSLFRNERFCAFGVTCMAGLLSSRNAKVGNRELYLFAGYATRAPEPFSATAACAAIPSLAGLRRGAFRPFRPLYQHVNRFWQDERVTFSPEEVGEITHPWQDIPDLNRLTDEHRIDHKVLTGTSTINCSPSLVRMFPVADASRAWSDAVLANDRTTLCVGLPNSTAVMRSPFLNAGVLTLKQTRDEPREDSGQTRSTSGSTATSPEPIQTKASTPAPQADSDGSSGFSRMVGSLFRKPTPLEPMPDETSGTDGPSGTDDDGPFTRRWKQEEDPDGWIDH